MEYSLGFSPCPNDTFIFDALVQQKIDTKGIRFKVYLEDVQTLNEWALEGRLDFSKISFGTWPLVKKEYRLLEAGGAMGKGVGPLLVAKKNIENIEEAINEMKIALPGKNTTAHFLFSKAFPKAAKKYFMRFDEIESSVLSGEVDAGVIIHENRFTYANKGLVKITDLGTDWEERTGMPIPLGGIIAHHRVEKEIAEKVDSMIRKSLEYAFEQYPTISSYVKEHAQEMDEEIMRQHIHLYVNEFSLNAGEKGKAAIATLERFFSSHA